MKNPTTNEKLDNKIMFVAETAATQLCNKYGIPIDTDAHADLMQESYAAAFAIRRFIERNTIADSIEALRHKVDSTYIKNDISRTTCECLMSDIPKCDRDRMIDDDIDSERVEAAVDTSVILKLLNEFGIQSDGCRHRDDAIRVMIQHPTVRKCAEGYINLDIHSKVTTKNDPKYRK